MAEAAETVRLVAMGIRAGIRCHTHAGLWIPYAKHLFRLLLESLSRIYGPYTVQH
jgi:hypothetical protein